MQCWAATMDLQNKMFVYFARWDLCALRILPINIEHRGRGMARRWTEPKERFFFDRDGPGDRGHALTEGMDPTAHSPGKSSELASRWTTGAISMA